MCSEASSVFPIISNIPSFAPFLVYIFPSCPQLGHLTRYFSFLKSNFTNPNISYRWRQHLDATTNSLCELISVSKFVFFTYSFYVSYLLRTHRIPTNCSLIEFTSEKSSITIRNEVILRSWLGSQSKTPIG